MSRIIHRWQGEPVEPEYGWFHAKPNIRKPLSWYNYECSLESNAHDGSTAIEAIRFEYNGKLMVISNHFGIGIHKLKHGGWPTHQHFSFGEGRFMVGSPNLFHYRKLDEKAFAEHEAKRERWMKEVDPIGYERIIELRRLITKNRIT